MIDRSKPYATQFPTGLLEQNGKLYRHDGTPYAEEAIYGCSVCGKEFDTERGLLLHGRKAHAMES